MLLENDSVRRTVNGKSVQIVGGDQSLGPYWSSLAKLADPEADLRILRQNSAVRAQAVGAVIAAFLVYTVVMIVLGRTGDYLLWLWIPIVASGVLVGLVLDLAHRRAAKNADQSGR